jgi:glutamine---fructose-6-phosphate transaminase (isomerizing)
MVACGAPFRPADLPLVVIGAPGRSYAHTAAVAAAARQLGRRVVAVNGPGDTLINRHAHAVVPVARSARHAPTLFMPCGSRR